MQVYKYRFLKRIIAFARDKLEDAQLLRATAVAVGATPPSVP